MPVAPSLALSSFHDLSTESRLFSRTVNPNGPGGHRPPEHFEAFSMIPDGDVLAVSLRVMSQVELNDHEPGVPPEVRRIAGGALAFIITIVSDHATPASAQLVIRQEPDGQLLAALLAAPTEPA
jgi:hypothetical protein